MLADRDDGARLHAFGALGIARDKAHLIADLELVESAVCDAVAVEINLAGLGAQNEPVVFLREKPADAPVIGHRVHFDLAPTNARVVFELAPGGIEGVVNGDVNVLMVAPRLRVAPDYDFATGNRDIDPDAEQIALMVAPVLTLDGDRQDMIWSQNRSSSSACSRIRSSIAAEEAACRNVICSGSCIALSSVS